MRHKLPLFVLYGVVIGLATCATVPTTEGGVPKDRFNFVETVDLVGDSATALVGWRTFEQPAYEVLRQEGPFEVRAYPEMHVARTSDVGEGAAFNRLFQYLGGANERENKVAMTAPALMQEDADETTMVFVLPGRYTAETAPAPEDERIAMETLEPTRYATVRFAGRMTDENLGRRTAELRDWVAANDLRPVGEPLYAGYDPPFTLPVLRRNEVWLRVD